MTEDEAKTKWCPFAHSRVVRWDKRVGHETYNALWDDPPTVTCIASACMAWRKEGYALNGEPCGHCGLAGAPFP